MYFFTNKYNKNNTSWCMKSPWWRTTHNFWRFKNQGSTQLSPVVKKGESWSLEGRKTITLSVLLDTVRSTRRLVPTSLHHLRSPDDGSYRTAHQDTLSSVSPPSDHVPPYHWFPSRSQRSVRTTSPLRHTRPSILAAGSLLIPKVFSPHDWQSQYPTKHWPYALPPDQRTTDSCSEPLSIPSLNTTPQLHHTLLGILPFVPDPHLLQYIRVNICELRVPCPVPSHPSSHFTVQAYDNVISPLTLEVQPLSSSHSSSTFYWDSKQINDNIWPSTLPLFMFKKRRTTVRVGVIYRRFYPCLRS